MVFGSIVGSDYNISPPGMVSTIEHSAEAGPSRTDYQPFFYRRHCFMLGYAG